MSVRSGRERRAPSLAYGLRLPAPAPGRAAIAGRLALVLAATFCGATSPEGREAAAGASPGPAAAGARAFRDGAPFAPGFEASLMATPLDVTGGFCEYRRGHFHGGFDFGTARRVGRPVVAPLPGWIERVRASGVGYGRSAYLRASDGRLLVFAHLDAFAEPLAAYVRAAQDSLGVYEQDLWPQARRFPFAAGETVGWSGESGAGGPHLHFEVRRGDMAYHPQRAGLAVPDSSPPSLTSLTLEPLDAGSRVMGSAGPRTFALERPETLEVLGRLRAIVGARDGVWAGVDRMVPWEVGMEWAGTQTLCRFDSVSWATDMEEGDLVYDAGRVLDSKGIVLWARAGYRPRVIRAGVPLASEAGTIVVRKGDRPRRLRLWARDVGGGLVEREVVLRPARASLLADASGAAAGSRPTGGPAAEPLGDPPLRFTALPGGAVRLALPATRERSAVEYRWGHATRAASRADDGWSAVFSAESSPRGDRGPLELGWRERDEAGRARAWRGRAQAHRGQPSHALELRDPDGRASVKLPAGALFEDATLIAFRVPATGTEELEPLGNAWRVEPASLPLRKSAVVTVPTSTGAAGRDVGLYRRSGEGWSWIGAADDSTARKLEATSRQLGAFALFRDTTAPRVTRWVLAGDTTRLPYRRWAFEAVVEEEGSGLAARASWLEVDGRRVPTEWDPEAGKLRWRPEDAVAPGPRRVLIVAADRAGNVARVEATFDTGR